MFIWYCATIVPIFYHFQEGYKLSLYFAVLGALICIPAVLITLFLRGKVRQSFELLLCCTGVINIAIDVVVVSTTKHPFHYEHVALMLGTNLNEGMEFFKSYFNLRLIIKLVGSLLSCMLVWILLKSVSDSVIYCSSCLISCMLIVACLFTNVLKSESWSELYLAKLTLFAKYSTPPDLREYASCPEVSVDEQYVRPDYLVVIFGESFSRSHSSLYGYEKNTNPLLSDYAENGCLVFDNIQSPTTGTVRSFQSMLSTFDESETQCEWFGCLTIFDVIKACGYECAWISNQSRVGTFDNVISKYAELADTTVWVGDAMGIFHKGFDGQIIDELPGVLPTLNGPTVVFIHLMGSHEKFADRFPESSSFFVAEDYMKKPANQRRTLADYDNSILYNDWVVATIFKYFEDENSVYIYLPDHGLDVYVSDPNFAGHATSDTKSVEEARSIPLLTYYSKQFAHNNASFVNRMIDAQQSGADYCTTDIIYTISELMGVMEINHKSVNDKSLFHMGQ